jgi:hypothetical protein
MNFLHIFVVSRRFSVKPKANPFDFWDKSWYFKKPQKNQVQHLDAKPRWNVGLTGGWNMNFWHVFRVNRCFSVKLPFGFWGESQYFSKPKKIVYNTVMSNLARICASCIWTMDFQTIFVVNKCFSVKLKSNPFGFWDESWYFLKPLKIYVHTLTSTRGTRWLSWLRNTYFWTIFDVNSHFSVKSKATHLGFVPKFDIF